MSKKILNNPAVNPAVNPSPKSAKRRLYRQLPSDDEALWGTSPQTRHQHSKSRQGLQSEQSKPLSRAVMSPAVTCPQDSPATTTFGIPSVVYIVGGWALAAIAFFGDFSGHQTNVVAHSFAQAEQRDLCQEVIQPNAVLARQDLAQVLALPERSSKAELRDVIAEPYCQLPGIEVRAGVMAMREAYPLAFDSQTWLVVLYEAEEYAGYAFHFAQ